MPKICVEEDASVTNSNKVIKKYDFLQNKLNYIKLN